MNPAISILEPGCSPGSPGRLGALAQAASASACNISVTIERPMRRPGEPRAATSPTPPREPRATTAAERRRAGGGRRLPPQPVGRRRDRPAAAARREPRTPPATATGRAARPAAADRMDLGMATVTGDREQPKVMYIVPWKKSDIGDLSGKPMNSLLDEALAPIDRDEFKRRSDVLPGCESGCVPKWCIAGTGEAG